MTRQSTYIYSLSSGSCTLQHRPLAPLPRESLGLAPLPPRSPPRPQHSASCTGCSPACGGGHSSETAAGRRLSEVGCVLGRCNQGGPRVSSPGCARVGPGSSSGAARSVQRAAQGWWTERELEWVIAPASYLCVWYQCCKQCTLRPTDSSPDFLA